MAGNDLTLPPNLEHYLPPDLWRKLIADAPRRGVLLSALDRLRSILYLLSTYLPSHLVQEKMHRPVPGLVRGQLLNGTLLFADVSGFTALSERLAVLGQEGAERLTDLMNRYFSTMLEILSWSGGILLKFAGDATLVYFPEQRAGEQVHWAVRAGQRMMRAMADFAAVETPLGTLGLQMKMGVGTGHFLAASVGSAERMEYVVLGGAVTQTMAAEGVAEAGQIIVDEATAVGLDPSRCLEQAAGFYAVRPGTDRDLDDFEIKAEKRRARGAMPWSASPHAIVTQMEVALRQIQALTPYLAAELADRIVARARQRQVESEYRPTAVLFINFTGLETLLSAWGQGGVRRVTRLLSDYFNAMHQVIARHGGIVSRIDPYSRGSKMLVLFGAPVAHEDDPQRAVNVALAMGAELAMLNDRWRHTLASHLTPELDGPLIQQRSGITQGLTFAGQVGSSTRREYTVMGDDVNLAARLMASAQPGQILLSQRVYDAVVDYFAATTLDPVHVKGKSQPIPVYQVEGPRDDPLARRLRSQGPLVGRDAELEQGQAVLRQALARQGTLLTIRGPAGVGKSHLADELVAHGLARGARVLFSEGWSYTAEVPYAPWTTFLQALAGIALADHPQVCSEKLLRMLTELSLAHDEYADPLANLLGLQRAASAAVPHQPVEALAAPPQPQAESPQKLDLFDRLEQEVAERGENGLDLWRLAQERQQAQPGQMWQRLQTRVTAHERTRLFEAVCGLMARLSADAPLLLFFESAQWMDPASRELLNYLNERLHSWPVLVLMVQRSEDEDEPIQDARGGQQTLTLGPLSLEGTIALVAHLLGDVPAQTDLAHAIHEQSGGNPLFVEEIVRWLERTGQKGLDDLKGGLWTSGTFQELVLSRLDSLPQGQRDTAKAASVVGNEFRRGELGPLLPSTIDDATLNDYLSGLEDARLILLTEVGDDARYAFRQTLIREVVYESQPFAQRRELHARMASHLEADHADDLDYAELLAHHYYLAHRWLPAARYLLLSGYKARQRYAFPQAAGYYSQVLAALERLPPREVSPETMALKAQAHEGQGDVAVLLNDFAAAAAAYDAARSSLADEDPARLLVKLALVLPTQGQVAEAEACARRAWAAHEAAGELAAAATLAWLLWRANDAEAGDWIERVATLTAQGSGPWIAAVAALMTDLAGDWASAQQAYLALDEPVGAALAACRLGDQHLRQGDVARALALYNQAAETWDQESDACGLALARYRQAEAYLRSEGTGASRAALHEALGLLDACATATQDDRETVQKALAAVDAGQTGVWPPWRWQHYDDVFCISILFQP